MSQNEKDKWKKIALGAVAFVIVVLVAFNIISPNTGEVIQGEAEKILLVDENEADTPVK